MNKQLFPFEKKHIVCFSALVLAIACMPACNKVEKLKPAEGISSTIDESDGMAARNKPNIVIILADDLGYDAMPSNGNGTFQTPNIDRMVQEGMRFTQCHAAPLCSPSRFMLVSGKYNFRNYDTTGVLDPDEKTFGNLLKNAGYSTYVAGKWQFDGGDASIRGFGFDRYIVWNPFKQGAQGLIYKNADLYTNGSYMDKAITANTYDNDMYVDSVLYFMKENRQKRFFVYLPLTLCHAPYSPTPDDPEYADWVSGIHNGNNKYFPSMVKYTDKKIGQIVDSLKAWNLYNNTIVMFAGDNGTPNGIWYYFNGEFITGGKDEPTESGTRVPLVVTWPNGIAPGQVNNNLVDFTDFLPTVGEAAGVKVPPIFGTTDGISFYKQLRGIPVVTRQWIFCQLEQKRRDQTLRWTQDRTYKLYDDGGKFVNFILDPEERFPLTNLTPAEQQLKIEFQNRLDTLH